MDFRASVHTLEPGPVRWFMAASFPLQRVSGYGIRRALIAGIHRVVSRRDEINRINVFPVPDGDTGTNMAFTLVAVLQAVRVSRLASAGEVLRRAAAEAIDGARGNSGAILAQFFQGVSESLGPSKRISLEALAKAINQGAHLAREAMAEPREGTILSVIQAFAKGLREQSERGGRDYRHGFVAALASAQEALRRTPDQLAVLKQAGVVDAGARGFVDLLEGIAEFIERGRSAIVPIDGDQLGDAGIESTPGTYSAEMHRYCCECMVSAEHIARGDLKSALLALPMSSLVIAGTREKVRIHAHIDDPALLYGVAERFGRVSAQKADDMRTQAASAHSARSQVAIVTDSAADVPPEALEELAIHLVPVRISIGGRDYLDRISLSPKAFYQEVRESPVPPRTSQPPPGDFRRLFEFLLSHHQHLIYVGLSRTLSGTLQSGESAAERTDPERALVFDSLSGTCGQGLLVIWAAEAAMAGFRSDAILAGLAAMRPRTRYFAMIRDVRYGVRGGRAPKLALPLTKLLRLTPIGHGRKDGRVGLTSGLWGKKRLPERYAAYVLRKLDRQKTWRILIGHCDVLDEAQAVRRVFEDSGLRIDRIWVMDAGAGIGAHTGPGSIVIGVQDYTPPTITG